MEFWLQNVAVLIAPLPLISASATENNHKQTIYYSIFTSSLPVNETINYHKYEREHKHERYNSKVYDLCVHKSPTTKK